MADFFYKVISSLNAHNKNIIKEHDRLFYVKRRESNVFMGSQEIKKICHQYFSDTKILMLTPVDFNDIFPSSFQKIAAKTNSLVQIFEIIRILTPAELKEMEILI